MDLIKGLQDQQQTSMKFSIEDLPTCKCENCGGLFFRQALIMKKVSKLLTGQPTDELRPIAILRCDDCGEPLPDSMPDEKFIK